MPNLAGKVCLVTGASRGIGRGIAIQLVTYGATCYITGRNLKSLDLVKNEAKSRGSTGLCVPVQCDHSIDSEIEKVFQKIKEEQNGQLDLLVNNAYAAVSYLMDNVHTYFWDLPPESYDIVNNVGLRNHYICAVHACRLMVPKRKGLIVNVSSPGGKVYFILPQYGIGKAGKDKMAQDCSLELRKFNVTFLSLWPGAVKTETIMEHLQTNKNSGEERDKSMEKLFAKGESTELSGKCIAYLLADENVLKKSGSIALSADLAQEYGFKDIDGTSPTSMRSVRSIIARTPLAALADYIPSFLRIPTSIFMYLLSNVKPSITGKHRSNYE